MPLTALGLLVTTACNDPTPPQISAPFLSDPVDLPPPNGPGAPNAVVLITIDTLRADRTSFGGYDKPTTPFLASLANKGVLFSNTQATSSSTPLSMASIFTGLYPKSHGFNYAVIDPTTKVPVQPKLPDEFETIGEKMKDLGYITVGSTSNTNLATKLNFSQGFDQYTDNADFCLGVQVNGRADWLLTRALGSNFSSRWRDTKLFLWLHYFDPHDPYFDNPTWRAREGVDLSEEDVALYAGKTRDELKNAHPVLTESMTKALNHLYDGEVRGTDDVIKALWDKMGFDDNTLVIVTSDHGEELGEHGDFGHAQNLYQESTKVPFFIYWPKGLPGGMRIDEPVSIVDVYPTLMSILGSSAPPEVHGLDLLPFIKGEAPLPQRPLLMELTHSKRQYRSLRRGDEKVIERLHPNPSRALFDLKTDPGEQKDLAATKAAALKEAITAMNKRYDALPQPPTLNTATLEDQEEIEQLRAMGYLE